MHVLAAMGMDVQSAWLLSEREVRSHEGLALGAAGVAAERLLAALVAGHARHPVVTRDCPPHHSHP